MRHDVLRGILGGRPVVDPDDRDTMQAAHALEERGLLALWEHTYVDCVSPVDRDWCDILDRTCTGRIYLRTDLDEANFDYRCRPCGRDVYPEEKRHRTAIELIPRPDAIDEFVRERLARTARPVRERPPGLYRIETDAGDVHVLHADRADMALVLRPPTEPTLFIVTNDAALLHLLPEGAPVFRVADLALTSAKPFDDALAAAIGAPPPALTARAFIERRLAAPQAPPASPLGVAPGARWADVTMYVLNGCVLGIRAPGIASDADKFDPTQLGMVSQKNRKQTKSFDLLVQLCTARGRLDPKDTESSLQALRMQVATLGTELRRLFGIDDPPFEELRRNGPLVSRFAALPEPPREGVYINVAKEVAALNNRHAP